MNNNPNRPANANRRPPDPNGQGSRTNGAPERGSPPQRTRSPNPMRPPRPDPAQMSDEEYARYRAWLAQKRVRQAQAQAQAQNRQMRNRSAAQDRNPNRGARVRQRTPEEAAREQARRREIARRRAEAREREQARLDYERRIREEEKRVRRTENRVAAKRIGRGALYVLAAAAILALLIGGGIFIALHNTPDAPIDTGKIAYYYGGIKVRSTDAETAMDGEELYICFNDLADYLGMKESGSAAEMKFILPQKDSSPASSVGDGTEESVTFLTGEHKVVVNGQTELLDVPNKLVGEEVWISSSFLTDWMNNLAVTLRSGGREVRISRILDEENSDPDNKINVYFPVTFRLKKNEPLTEIPEDTNVGLLTESLREATPFELNFQTDLSEFEDYMNPQGELRDAFLVLVNADHPLSATDVPGDLMDVKYTSTYRNMQQLREYPTRALEGLFQEMHYYGYYSMAVYSGYRSYDYQATIFEQYVQNEMASDPTRTREEAEALVLTYATRPGTSEHQTGLAVDMDTLGSFTVEFAWTTEFYWLQENAWKFGFILRFPQDKEDVTSITFEPWHYRYVGRYHAKIMHDNGLCLEEYIARISN
ncbi:MAG: M15 family metallopeptidase [Clostridia bacterium]|nr:M15 family metallopeptidase [Clostridia bacterium]